MKFLILTLIALSASFICIDAQQTTRTPQETRDRLLGRARYLMTLLEGEIRILRFEGHDLQAEGLERELEQLITLEVDLRVTEIVNVTNSQLTSLDNRMNEVENRIQQQLTQVGRQFVSRREIEELLRRTSELITLVSTEVKILRQQNRSLSARGLEEEEARLVKLEVEIRATQRPTELRRLEELLVQADVRVWELLGSLNATRKRRDLRDDVIARANELITLSNDAIKALNATANRTQAVELISRAQRNLVRIENELKNATNASTIARLEEELLREEFTLTQDLARVGRPVSTNETRAILLTAGEYLWARANRTIAQLRNESRTNDILEVETEGRRIGELVQQVRAATNETQLRQLEQRLGEAEIRFYELLERLGRNPADPREIQRVLRRAEELAVRVTIEIRELFRRNRSLEAEGLLEEEQALIRLDVEIRDAISVAEIRALEERLDRLEERVVEQMRRLGLIRGNAPTKRDLKADVLKRATELINVTNEAIAYFTSRNRTQAVTLLRRTERELNQTVAELNALTTTNQTALGILEGRVLRIEFELVDDLRRFGRPIDANERRDLLVTRADSLEQWATARIAQLKAQNRSLAIQRVEAEEATIKRLVGEVKNASGNQLDRLERELDGAEERFIEELRALGEPVIKFEDVLQLTRRAEDLAVRIVIAIRTLREQGRILLVEGLQDEERVLIHLDAQIRTATTPTQIQRFEGLLRDAETRVQQELTRLGL